MKRIQESLKKKEVKLNVQNIVEDVLKEIDYRGAAMARGANYNASIDNQRGNKNAKTKMAASEAIALPAINKAIRDAFPTLTMTFIETMKHTHLSYPLDFTFCELRSINNQRFVMYGDMVISYRDKLSGYIEYNLKKGKFYRVNFYAKGTIRRINPLEADWETKDETNRFLNLISNYLYSRDAGLATEQRRINSNIMTNEIRHLSEMEFYQHVENAVNEVLNEIDGKTHARVSNAAVNAMRLNQQGQYETTLQGVDRSSNQPKTTIINHDAVIAKKKGVLQDANKSLVEPFATTTFVFYAIDRFDSPSFLTFNVSNIKKLMRGVAILSGKVVYDGDEMKGDIMIDFKKDKVTYTEKGTRYKYPLIPDNRTVAKWNELLAQLKMSLDNRIKNF